MSASVPTLAPATAAVDRPEHRLAVRLAFLVAGFGIACWAPLVPFARERLGIDDGALGALLLCLGLGSVAAMVAAGALSTRFGTRPVIVGSGLGLALVLPWLVVAASPWTLGLALMAFGACLGSLDVAMNINALEVERGAGRPMMSGFHALYSVGGFIGAGVMTLLLSTGFEPLHAVLLAAAPMVVAMVVAWPYVLATGRSAEGPLFVRPRGVVWLMALLAAATFLAEGAVLDWGALLITGAGLVPEAQGGLGFMLFSVAMTAGRFAGDAIVSRLGDRATLRVGGLVAVAGVAALLLASSPIVAFVGFVLIGLGASNLVPVLFRRAGQQSVMPAAFAVSAVTTAGYAGVLLGPALIGFLTQAIGLASAFWLLAALLVLVPLSAGRLTR
ncbi:MAG: MFS transporter [Mitsuaria chitosanitabida]|uniref:MFS transporter n=1 Tax=Roseateles chitosanitabidus TaxID=65048 RepID=UPI001B2121F0|nr:MFS transporter [Roseateles chitosanitabidus]MBO9685356.1 MFS transporter [Roseateles chitosanitabidus]